MFGGYSSKYLNDEWVLSAGVWYQMSSSGVPSARRGAALTYDPVLSKLVLFGGYNGSSYLSDTYLYDGMVDAWTRPSLTTMPSTRQLAGLAFGPGTSAVLFGGLNGSTRTADTWSLSGVLTPRVPSVPISPIAAASNGAAFVSWSWPVDNGGASISAFTVTASPGGQRTTVAGTRTSATLSGLTNGTSYSFTVAASNSVGTGPSSGSTNAVVPVNNGPTVPGAPTAVTATAGNAQASVSWTAPSSNGGASITGYTVTSSPGNFQATTTGATSATVGGLANGTAYTFAVTATNSVGTGPASGPSNSVSPTGPPTVPGAPTGVSALAGNTQASVSWVAPGSNGGSPLTGYTVTSSPGNFTVTASPNVTTATVTGLTNGTGYTFTVAATNSVGTGAQSAPSNSVTPAGLPGAPTGVTATAGIGQATVSWIAPASNGGSALTGYTVTSMPGNITVSAGPSATNATVAGLTNGTAYTFTVTATNSVGTGPASAPSNSVTPTATVPGAPTNVTGTPGNAQATVSWTPPASNGGSAITSFTVTQTPGGVTSNTGPSATSLTVFGLTNGTAYTFTVFATNGVGNGPASAPSNTVTPVGSATISNLVVGDTTNAANWSIQQNIQVGNLEYGDRTYTIKTLPSTLAGSQWIRPANASKTSTANPLVTFTISAPMTIYVAVDVRIGKRPWMDSSWTDTNTQITDSETTPATFEIFQKSITTAGQVSLGPNAASGSTYIQYLVIAR
jgi:hypothetical protein